MKLSEFPAAHLLRALEIYVAEAFGGAPCPRLPPFPDVTGQTIEALLPPKLAVFRHEPRKPPNKIVNEYTLQLGNARYPLMKFVLGEHLIVGEYFLSVDTHDWMFEPEAHERRQWDETLRFNCELKARIERRWSEEHLPTLHDLRRFLSASRNAPPTPHGLRVLVVDDDEVAAEILKLFLESHGFEVELARDGVEALEKADASRHHLVIMDVDMPRKTGLEACAELRADPARRNIPVLLSSKRELGEHPPAGANAFLVKPFPADVLVYFLEGLLPTFRAARGPGPAS